MGRCEWVPNSIIIAFTHGYYLDGVAPLPRMGALIEDDTTGDVYYLHGSVIYLFTDLEAFEAYGFEEGDIYSIPQDALLRYYFGYKLDGVNALPDGTLA